MSARHCGSLRSAIILKDLQPPGDGFPSSFACLINYIYRLNDLSISDFMIFHLDIIEAHEIRELFKNKHNKLLPPEALADEMPCYDPVEEVCTREKNIQFSFLFAIINLD